MSQYLVSLLHHRILRARTVPSTQELLSEYQLLKTHRSEFKGDLHGHSLLPPPLHWFAKSAGPPLPNHHHILPPTALGAQRREKAA